MVLQISNLTKNYGNVKALNNVSLNIPQHCIYGLLGPNGSGKTTMLGIVLDIIHASSGTYNWVNFASAESARKKTGSLLETPNFYPYLNAVQNLEIVAAIKGVNSSNINECLKTVNLYERRFSNFQTFSLGMKQRLAIASALLGDPDIILFDEPTNGLDPAGIADIRSLIVRLYQSGKTIILASHLLHEVEQVCTHVAIIKKGNLLAEGPVEIVLSEKDVFQVASEKLVPLREFLNQLNGISHIQQAGKFITFSADGFTPEQINKLCAENNHWLTHLNVQKASLENKFIELTN